MGQLMYPNTCAAVFSEAPAPIPAKLIGTLLETMRSAERKISNYQSNRGEIFLFQCLDFQLKIESSYLVSTFTILGHIHAIWFVTLTLTHVFVYKRWSILFLRGFLQNSHMMYPMLLRGFLQNSQVMYPMLPMCRSLHLPGH